MRSEKEEIESKNRNKFFKNKQLPIVEGSKPNKKGDSDIQKNPIKPSKVGETKPKHSSGPKRGIPVMFVDNKGTQSIHVQINVDSRPRARHPLERRRI